MNVCEQSSKRHTKSALQTLWLDGIMTQKFGPPRRRRCAYRRPEFGMNVATTNVSPFLPGKEQAMLRLALLFLVIAMIAGALGLYPVAAISSQIAWVLFVIFLALFVLSLLAEGL